MPDPFFFFLFLTTKGAPSFALSHRAKGGRARTSTVLFDVLEMLGQLIPSAGGCPLRLDLDRACQPCRVMAKT
jgi:hypothetical protein